MDELTRTFVDLLRPLQGAEKINPYTQLCVGIVVKVYASIDDVTDVQHADRYIGSVQVRWLDKLGPIGGLNPTLSGSQQIIPWTYASFSNPLINQPESTTSQGATIQNSTVGSSYGIYFVPSVGDIVVCGFRGPSTPVILGFLPQNLYKQQMDDDSRPLSFGSVRTLIGGEFAIKGLQQNEVYLDQAGTVQIIVKQQPAGSGDPPIDQTQVPTKELGRISLGNTYVDDGTFSTPVLSTYGNQIVCQINLSNGSHVQIDSVGNIDLQASGSMHVGAPNTMSVASGAQLLTGALNTLMSTVNGMTIGAATYDLKTTGASTWEGQSVNINQGTQGAARMLDQTLSNAATDAAFWTFIQTLVTTFNTHTHLYSPGPGGPTPTAPPLPPIVSQPTQQVGQINSASGTVKVGN